MDKQQKEFLKSYYRARTNTVENMLPHEGHLNIEYDEELNMYVDGDGEEIVLDGNDLMHYSVNYLPYEEEYATIKDLKLIDVSLLPVYSMLYFYDRVDDKAKEKIKKRLITTPLAASQIIGVINKIPELTSTFIEQVRKQHKVSKIQNKYGIYTKLKTLMIGNEQFFLEFKDELKDIYSNNYDLTQIIFKYFDDHSDFLKDFLYTLTETEFENLALKHPDKFDLFKDRIIEMFKNKQTSVNMNAILALKNDTIYKALDDQQLNKLSAKDLFKLIKQYPEDLKKLSSFISEDITSGWGRDIVVNQLIKYLEEHPEHVNYFKDAYDQNYFTEKQYETIVSMFPDLKQVFEQNKKNREEAWRLRREKEKAERGY
jgi:hypothetical protein